MINKLKKQTKGITLIALVVTIIVLLILAGVAISLTIGKNGIFSRAQSATEEHEKASVKEELSMILADYQFARLSGEAKELEEFLKEKGAENITDNGNGTIEIEYKDYVFTIDKESLEIKDTSKVGGIKPEIKVRKVVSTDKKKVTLTVEITNEVGRVDSIKVIDENGQEVLGTVNGKTGVYEIVSNGTYTIEVKATTEEIQRTNRVKEEIKEILVEFSTAYGKVDVIWIDTNNKIIDKPNNPANNLGGMTPVKWDGVTESETAASDPEWYEYKKISGTEDNRTSHWANAKNNGSYFVWIPRYAYRITYYANETSNIEAGYYDGRGMVDTVGNQKYELDEGIETVEKDGKSYIVHPAFMKDDTKGYVHGGWSSNLAGIWVAKYEMSMETNGIPTTTGSSSIGNKLTTDSIKAVSKPSVSSWRCINVGNMYTNSYNYAREKESHLMKNSEWGAVAYLTHSQYGRNGHEIDINNSSSYITGNGGGSTSASSASGTPNSYNSELGQKASSTGNIYGIYDLSGGAWERVAAFNSEDTNNYESTYGSSFAAPTNESTKYATKYSNNTTISSGTKIYEVGKTGDATKEAYRGSDIYNWFSDYSEFLHASSPFFERGGIYNDRFTAGVFCWANGAGGDYSIVSFRVVLSL